MRYLFEIKLFLLWPQAQDSKNKLLYIPIAVGLMEPYFFYVIQK